MFDAIPTMAEQARGGRVRALATTGPRRSPLLPDAPIVAEALPGYEASIWLGVMAPAPAPARHAPVPPWSGWRQTSSAPGPQSARCAPHSNHGRGYA
ncbi:MAG: tripartite tricarboxylate transporter substrate-binding protein [Alphaproteobacteria bacterium]